MVAIFSAFLSDGMQPPYIPILFTYYPPDHGEREILNHPLVPRVLTYLITIISRNFYTIINLISIAVAVKKTTNSESS